MGGVDLGAALESHLDEGLVIDVGEEPGQDELAERLDRAGGLGRADLVAQVHQGGGVVLAGNLDLLAGRLRFHLGQGDGVGRDLVGLQPPPQRVARAGR